MVVESTIKCEVYKNNATFEEYTKSEKYDKINKVNKK